MKHIKKPEDINNKIKKKKEKPFFEPIIISKDEMDKIEKEELKKEIKIVKDS